jgi:hypothetical protein
MNLLVPGPGKERVDNKRIEAFLIFQRCVKDHVACYMHEADDLTRKIAQLRGQVRHQSGPIMQSAEVLNVSSRNSQMPPAPSVAVKI